MDRVVKTVLDSMSTLNKPQKTFMALLLSTLVVVQGKANFRNMSRYCEMSEKRFSRWYRRTFEFLQFNVQLIFGELPTGSEYIAAIDASFMSKSGKTTDGLGMFYHGGTSSAERGLELSLISVIHLKSNTAYALDARQTLDQEGKTRVDLCAEQTVTIAPLIAPLLLKQGIRYLASDSYYAKKKFVTPVTEAGLEIVGKLRTDADLRWLFTGEQPGRGRPKKYDGKINFDKDIDRFEPVGSLNEHVDVYSTVAHSSCLKRAIKVVFLRIQRGHKIGRALLFSTDTTLDAMTLVNGSGQWLWSMTLVAYYKARFQIEFVFRDAKQYTGLMDCQSRKKEAIHTPINASFTALNMLKLEDRRKKDTQQETVISIATWKRRKFNQHLLQRVFEQLELNPKDEKVMQAYAELSSYGAIAA